MEALLRNLESTVELLAVSHTDMVCEWDSDTVDRAFQWARYCEHLYTRFHTKLSVCSALENRLRETNQLLASTFAGYHALSLSDLAQCRHRLLAALLKNPSTPHLVIKLLLEKFGLVGGAEEDWRVDVCGLSESRSACELLGDFKLDQKSDLGLSVGTLARGMMLMQHIQAIQNHTGNQTYAKEFLDCLLEGTGEAQDSFLSLAASALLSTDTLSEFTNAQTFLLDWFKGHDGLLQSMFQFLSPELCITLSQQWPKFRLAYWDFLKQSASFLEYDVSNGSWIQSCDSALSFPSLAKRLKSFWNSGSALKEETEERLISLKQADGDFEVEGLSVWTDLLVQLNKSCVSVS